MTINKAMVVHTFNPRTWEVEEGEISKTVRATQRFPCCKKTVHTASKKSHQSWDSNSLLPWIL